MEKSFLLDTDTISYGGDEKSPYYESVIRHFKKLSLKDKVYLSNLSLYEYKAGLYLLDDKEKKRVLKGFNEIMRYINILPLEPFKGGIIFGEIRFEYQKRIGISDSALKKHIVDMILASEAICHHKILVSNDKIYEKIAEIRSDFKMENWTN